LGRALLVVVDAHDRLDALGVALVSATEHIDTSSPSGRPHLQMLGSFAEFERASIRERTRDVLHRAFRNGRQTGAVPYGFTIDEDGSFVVMPEEAEIVAHIFENVAAGATLYSEAKRLNDLGLPSPGWRYGTGERKPGKQWAPPTIRNIVHQRAYAGTHRVKTNGGRDIIAREVPAIVTPELQQRALKVLTENKRFSGGRKHRSYLLAGLVACETCGCSCIGQTHVTRGKKCPYYRCSDDQASRSYRGPTHRAPHVNAEWLEGMVWADVRRFVENPGQVLDRVREQFSSDDAHAQLEARHEDLSKRLAAKYTERDRWLHLFARGSITEGELDDYLADLRAQTDNLRLLLQSAENDLASKHEEAQIAASTEAWLAALRERVSEVEGDSPEAFEQRRQLVRLLVQSITVGRDEDGNTRVEVTYRFGPPAAQEPEDPHHDDEQHDEELVFVGGIKDSPRSSAENG
jgi:site-specific DNA recombinase